MTMKVRREARDELAASFAPIGGHVADADIELAEVAPGGSGASAGPWRALLAGTAGALVLNAVHEAARRTRPDAPRVNEVGARAVTALSRLAGRRPPRGRTLHRLTLAGDVVANALYYAALLGRGPARPLLRSLLGGAGAGSGALVLSPLLGLGRVPGTQRARGRLMTVAWYALGGVAAAMTYRALGGRRGR